MRTTGRRGGGRRRPAIKKPDPHSLEAKLAAERRQRLYQSVKDHLAKGNPDLPILSEDEVHDVEHIARIAGDARVVQLCRDW